jgi:murein DD-endopeptidase MepM/ murein hydrolase activator NlpD
MKRRQFTKWNKEKASIYVSAILIVCVCVVSGVYAGSQSPSKKQIIDLESIEEDETAQQEDGEDTTLPVAVNTQSAMPAGGQDAEEQAGADATDLTGDVEVADAGLTEQMSNAESIATDTNSKASDTYSMTNEGGNIASNTDSTITDANSIASKKAELHFNGEEGLSWPIIGNVVMNYSMDERTYFATMNQYCYYPAVAISAEEGAPVNAAAQGIVTKTGINEEIGQYVVMDLGDDYEATYGQLENLTVAQGNTVSKGQIIGYIAAPTKYYSLEGTNLYFKLEQNGESINPVNYFK